MNELAKVELTDVEFSSIRQMVFENTGISLSASKRELVKRRFTPRLKELGMGNFASYIKHVRNNHEKEIANFCNAITTNLTSFFRENHHFDFMKEEALPKILKRNSMKGRKLRIWSAGCSTGQEAYCLAMTLKKSIPAIGKWNVKILASDLDEKCLKKAGNGSYPADGFDKVSSSLISKYFVEREEVVNRQTRTMLQANDELKSMIAFNKLNLMDSNWPMKGKFDIIFCRNVFIYFDKETQVKLMRRYSALQSSGSYLCLGHSESIADPKAVGYKLVGKTTYIRE